MPKEKLSVGDLCKFIVYDWKTRLYKDHSYCIVIKEITDYFYIIYHPSGELTRGGLGYNIEKV